MILSRLYPQGGTTLIEAIIAAGLSALFLGSLFAMNTASMTTIRMARDSEHAQARFCSSALNRCALQTGTKSQTPFG